MMEVTISAANSPFRRFWAAFALWLPLAGFFSIGGVADVARGRLPMAITVAKAVLPPAHAPAAPDEDDKDFAAGETEQAETESGETESGGDHMLALGGIFVPSRVQESYVDPHQAFLPEPPFIPTVIPPDGQRASV